MLADLGPQMMPHPFRVKFRVMRDLGLLGRSQQVPQRSQIRIRPLVTAEGTHVDHLCIDTIRQLHQPQLALIRIKLRRLDIKPQKRLIPQVIAGLF